LISTKGDFKLIESMTFVVMGFDIPMTMGTKIVIGAGGAFISDAENGFVAAVAEDMGMETAVNVGTHAGLSWVVTGGTMWSPERGLNLWWWWWGRTRLDHSDWSRNRSR
jgi:hypothetical protein